MNSRRYHAPPPAYRGPIEGTRPPASAGDSDFLFQNRTAAGTELGAALEGLKDRSDVVVLGVPRGGVMVGLEVARALNAPLDVWISCQLHAPGNLCTIGFVSEDGDMIVDETAVNRLRIPPAALVSEIQRQRSEVRRRSLRYRDGEPPLSLSGKTVVVVDDGVTTGTTIRPVLQAIARSRPARCIVALPVAPAEQIKRLSELADEVVVLATPAGFRGVGDFYMHFRQVTDEDVTLCLRSAQSLYSRARPPA